MSASSKLRSRKSRLALIGATVAAAVVVPSTVAMASTTTHSTAATSTPTSARAKATTKPTIVLEHGAWADGSSWDGVLTRLQKAGYTVDVPPNPLRGVKSDAAYLASYLKTVPGPIVLVGHSYGGFVTTNAATKDKDVKALVYVDAFIPAKGDTVGGLTAQFPGSLIAPTALNIVSEASDVADAYIKPDLFRSVLANDLSKREAAQLAATQEPIAASALGDISGKPAWKTIPSWAVIGTEDHAIPPAAQEFMAKRAHAKITKIHASHLSLISHPGAVTKVIERAARHA